MIPFLFPLLFDDAVARILEENPGAIGNSRKSERNAKVPARSIRFFSRAVTYAGIDTFSKIHPPIKFPDLN